VSDDVVSTVYQSLVNGGGGGSGNRGAARGGRCGRA